MPRPQFIGKQIERSCLATYVLSLLYCSFVHCRCCSSSFSPDLVLLMPFLSGLESPSHSVATFSFMGSLHIFLIFIFLLASVNSNPCEHSSSAHRTIVVDAGGSGDFTTIQAAVDFVPANNTERVTICIHAGNYVEKVVVPVPKPYVTLQGAGREVTSVEWHDRASDRGPDGQQLRTYNTASVTVLASDFSARNISFKNTAPAPMPGMEGWQAAALRISGDKAYFSGCGFHGTQDTLYDHAGRHYFKDCYIAGSIAFIFGNGRSMYKDCELHSISERLGSVATQERNSPYERTGFAFVGCKVMGTGKVYVGRAMGRYSRVVFAYTYFDDVVAPGGWDDSWDDDDTTKNKTAFFGVYRCWGPGAASVRGVSWARELDYETARPFLAESFVNGRHWLGPSDP